MATRFYLHKGSGAFFTPSITPIFHPEWDAVDNAVRRLATTEKLGSVVATTTTISEASSAAPYDFLFGQFISFPLLAQTISGDISGVIRSRETTTAGDFNYAFCAKVVSEDGTIIRGTLFEGFPGSITTEMYYTQLRNWYMPPLSAMTPVVCQNGDRIVFEIGVRSFNTSGLSIGAEINFDDINATDLVYNQTGSTHGAPWVELSGDIGFITSANLDSFQVDVEYIDDHIELDSLQVDVEYGETLAILDQFYVDVEYEESTISEIDNDSLQVDVEYEELPLLKLNKIDFQCEVETYEYESTNFIFDMVTDLYIPTTPGQILNSYLVINDHNFIDGIRFNSKYYFLSSIMVYSENKVCYNISLVESLLDYNNIELLNQTVILIQTFPKISNTLESMNWYSVWKHSGKNLVEYDGKIWFALTDAPTGYVYSYDGSTVTEEYKDETLDDYVGPSDIKVYNGKLFIAMSDHVLMYDGVSWTKTYPITLSDDEILSGTYIETYSMCVHDDYLYLSITKKTLSGESCTVSPYLYRYNTSWVVQTLFNVSTVGEGLLQMTSFNDMIYFIAKRGTMSYCSTVNYYDSIAVLNTTSFAVTHLHTSGIGYGAGIYYYYCCLGLSNDENTLFVGGYNFIKEVDVSNTITTTKTITTNSYFVNTINITDLGDLRNGIYWLNSKDNYCCEDI